MFPSWPVIMSDPPRRRSERDYPFAIITKLDYAQLSVFCGGIVTKTAIRISY